MSPSAPKRRCLEPGCPGWAEDRGRCRAHAVRYWRADQLRRGTAAQRGYDAAYQRARRQQLAAFPTCARCAAPAEHVHHRVPLRLGGSHEPENLVSLCSRCHIGGHNAARRRW